MPSENSSKDTSEKKRRPKKLLHFGYGPPRDAEYDFIPSEKPPGGKPPNLVEWRRVKKSPEPAEEADD